jgi:hypothetical protein
MQEQHHTALMRRNKNSARDSCFATAAAAAAAMQWLQLPCVPQYDGAAGPSTRLGHVLMHLSDYSQTLLAAANNRLSIGAFSAPGNSLDKNHF